MCKAARHQLLWMPACCTMWQVAVCDGAEYQTVPRLQAGDVLGELDQQLHLHRQQPVAQHQWSQNAVLQHMLVALAVACGGGGGGARRYKKTRMMMCYQQADASATAHRLERCTVCLLLHANSNQATSVYLDAYFDSKHPRVAAAQVTLPSTCPNMHSAVSVHSPSTVRHASTGLGAAAPRHCSFGSSACRSRKDHAGPEG